MIEFIVKVIFFENSHLISILETKFIYLFMCFVIMQGGSGYAENIIFQNIKMDNVSNPIIIDQNYCDQKKPCNEQVRKL